MEYYSVIRSFIDEPVTDITNLCGGHINMSFLVTAKDRYVLQRLNGSMFKDIADSMASNYIQYVSACKKIDWTWKYPEWLPSAGGGFFFRDDDGSLWRMYRFIPSEELKDTEKTDTYTIGLGLGKLHKVLKNCENIADIGVLAKVHDLSYHYEKYNRQDHPENPRIEEFDRVIDDNIEGMSQITVPADSVIHGDAKVSNMIIQGGEVTGFLDLDTIMTGSVYDDLADCARSCCMDSNGLFDHSRIGRLVSGYENGSGRSFTKEATELLNKVIVRDRFLLGIRYYTDYLSDEGVFSDQDMHQKLDRARRLLDKGQYNA